jgi:hypothetical protein
MQAKTEAPEGDTWRFRREASKIVFEIWNGIEYLPIHNNNGTPENFAQEVNYHQARGTLRQFANRIYKGGQ